MKVVPCGRRIGERSTLTFVTTRNDSRAVTINDVASAAGVSRAAVSKVIRDASGVSPAMRERVNQAIADLGYRPSVAARAMRGRSYRLGLEIPHISARFMGQVVDGAKTVLAGTPYHLVVAPADGPEYGAIETLADGFVDGLIAVSPMVDPSWLEQLAARVPVVMLGRHDPAENYDTVVGDDVVGAREVMRHLLQLGHRRIAHVTESAALTNPGSGTPHAQRLQTYRDCMAEAGLETQVEVREGPAAAPAPGRPQRSCWPGPTRPRPSSPGTTTSRSTCSPRSPTAAAGQGRSRWRGTTTPTSARTP